MVRVCSILSIVNVVIILLSLICLFQSNTFLFLSKTPLTLCSNVCYLAAIFHYINKNSQKNNLSLNYLQSTIKENQMFQMQLKNRCNEKLNGWPINELGGTPHSSYIAHILYILYDTLVFITHAEIILRPSIHPIKCTQKALIRNAKHEKRERTSNNNNNNEKKYYNEKKRAHTEFVQRGLHE